MKLSKLKTCLLCRLPVHKINGIRTKYCPNHLVKETLRKQREKAKQRKVKEKERRVKSREAKRNSISSLTKKADALFSQAIRLRDGKSRKSGETKNLQCSHIWSRSNKFIRWDMDNALTLTAGEHLYWWHKEPAEAIEWAKKELGEKKWKELERKKNMVFKLTPEFIKERIEYLQLFIQTVQLYSTKL